MFPAALAFLVGPVAAQETDTYTYNAKGQLTGVSRAGGPVAGAVTTYGYDNAENRASVAVTASSNTLVLSPSTLPGGTVGTSYSQTITATGGTGLGYTFSVSTGALPAGLSLAAGGVLSGTPSAIGTSNFTIRASDSASHLGSQAYSVTINAATLTLSPASLPNGTVGTAYSRTITASGGTGSGYTYSLLSGTLPAGLNLSSSGLLSGTPAANGTSNFTVRATDSASDTGSRAYSIVVGTGATTIQLVTGTGENLRTIANSNGYSGSSSANYTFVVGNAVTVTGAAGGGVGIDTGTWPAGVTLTLQVNSGGIVRGGGGNGGKGGGVSGTLLVSPVAGGAGGDAVQCHANIFITVSSGGTVQAGGGGGGGGGVVGGGTGGGPGGYAQDVPGSGGGGGAPNGAGGAGNIGYPAGSSSPGSAGTTTGGGAGGTTDLPGGGGGTYATAGSAGANGNAKPGAAGGAAGYAIRKNGTGCTVTNGGTVTGTVG
jgi:YD repeat-containing protein